MLLLDLLVLFSVIGVMAVVGMICYSEGRKTGRAEGEASVWYLIAGHIRTYTPIFIKHQGPGGLEHTKEYDIRERKEHKSRLEQPIEIQFSDKPDEEDCTSACLTREGRVFLDIEFSPEEIPKGLWGKKLQAKSSYSGWDWN